MEIFSLDDMVPKDHLVRKMEAAIDWNFIYELVEPLYCEENAYRKETIERDSGLAKELHGFRYTQMYGKARMEMKAALTFACMNLKKLAKKRWRGRLCFDYICCFLPVYAPNPACA